MFSRAEIGRGTTHAVVTEGLEMCEALVDGIPPRYAGAAFVDRRVMPDLVVLGVAQGTRSPGVWVFCVQIAVDLGDSRRDADRAPDVRYGQP